MLYGREARLHFGADQEMLISSPMHGPAKYVEELKKRQNDLRKLATKRIEKAHQKQKRCYDSRYRAQLHKCFNVGDTVLLKNFQARGLDEKYTGPYLIVNVRGNDCEIESMDNRNKKRKVVHADNLRQFVVDPVESPVSEDSENILSSDADESFELTNEHVMIRPRNYVIVEPRVEPVNLRYNLRRDKRQPDHYGLPVYNY